MMLVFLPSSLFAQMGREPAYNIVITPITYDPVLRNDSDPIYESLFSELSWQGQLNSLYRLFKTTGSIGDPPSILNLPVEDQAQNPRYVVTANLFMDGPERVISMNLYNAATFDLTATQEMAYISADEVLGMMAYFAWNLSSNLPPDDRPIEFLGADIVYVTPEEDITWKDKWLYLGLQGGISFRLYASQPGSDSGIFTLGTTFDAGMRAELQLFRVLLNKGSLISVSIETGADISQERLNWRDYKPTEDIVLPLDVSGGGSSGLSISFPGLIKFNYKPGIIATSFYAGAYFILPLDDSKYNPPLGITAGLSAGLNFGPGLLYADFHYGFDLGPKEFNYIGEITYPDPEPKREMPIDIIYRRQTFSLVVGYKFGFFDKLVVRTRANESTSESP